jgi:hypothetical protein
MVLAPRMLPTRPIGAGMAACGAIAIIRIPC